MSGGSDTLLPVQTPAAAHNRFPLFLSVTLGRAVVKTGQNLTASAAFLDSERGLCIIESGMILPG